MACVGPGLVLPACTAVCLGQPFPKECLLLASLGTPMWQVVFYLLASVECASQVSLPGEPSCYNSLEIQQFAEYTQKLEKLVALSPFM